MITWENYEEYMMMHADGELSAAEEQALMAFVQADAGLQKELAAYTAVKLQPDATVVFTDKNSLLRQEPKVVAFPLWMRYGIAAGVAAILFVSLFDSRNTITNATIANTAIDSAAKQTIMPAAVTTGVAAKIDTATTAAPQVAIVRNTVAAVFPSHSRRTAAPSVKNIVPQAPAATQLAAANTVIHSMTPAAIQALPGKSIAAAVPVATAVPPLPAAAGDEAQKRSLLDKLPIGDLKKQGLADMANALATGADRLSSLKQELGETSITVKVEKRKLILSF